MRKVVLHIIRSKATFWLKCVPLQHKPKSLVTGKGGEKLLVTGELSDGGGRSVKVPKGSVAVYVGPELRRFVIPANYLSMPEFQDLMERVVEEFGYEQEGGLRIPCEEEDFENILSRCLAMHEMIRSNSRKKKITN